MASTFEPAVEWRRLGAGDEARNDYDRKVCNDDLGFVRSIDAEAGEVLVTFGGREVRLRLRCELHELVLAYATTIDPGSAVRGDRRSA